MCLQTSEQARISQYEEQLAASHETARKFAAEVEKLKAELAAVQVFVDLSVLLVSLATELCCRVHAQVYCKERDDLIAMRNEHQVMVVSLQDQVGFLGLP